MNNNEAKNLIGCCGLYCGLCSKFQSTAPSRCIGCQLGEQHSWCSIWSCCVKKHGFKTCAECEQLFQCEIFLRRKVADWIPAADNLSQIKAVGLEFVLTEQIARQAILEELLKNYNQGRSMSFYCKACSRMSIELIDRALAEAKKKLVSEKVAEADVRSKAKILKAVIQDLAFEGNVNLS